MNRRNFLKKSLIAAGMVAVPAVVVSKVIAAPVDPAQEYHLDICRDLYQYTPHHTELHRLYRQYPLTIRECYIPLLDLQQLHWLRWQNAINNNSL